jgi:hypothetical protein
MQAILVLNGRHLVGLNTDVSLFATTHGMWLPVLQAFATGWGGMLLGRSLVKGRRRLWLGWPLAVVLAWAGALVFGAVIRASALCRTDIASASWCSGGEPNHVVAVFAWVGSAIILICIAVTAAALGGRHARLRAAAMEGLVTDGWYTRSEAAALSRRPARRALVTWATQRGGRAQARHFVATADDLMAMRMEIEDLPDPQPTPQDPRPGLLAEQDSTLKRSLSARESLRTAVAHGPGGWTAA